MLKQHIDNGTKVLIDFMTDSFKNLANLIQAVPRSARKGRLEDYCASESLGLPLELDGLDPEQPIATIDDLKRLHDKLGENEDVRHFYV